jgi:hypothetical protein
MFMGKLLTSVCALAVLGVFGSVAVHTQQGATAPTEACCFPDGSCKMLTAADCQKEGGTPMGAGTTCRSVDCNLGACCYRDGVFCVVVDRSECESLYGGIWHGPGTNCDDLNGDSLPDECEVGANPQIGCCLPDGTCKMLTAKECIDEHGEPQGPGSACVGDWNDNKIDDACEAKWIQPPDVNMTGVDVRDTVPVALADDFLCTEKNAITRIIVWGSWLHDKVPDDPANVSFKLMLRADIPDPDGSGPLFSMPGKILWSRSYRPYSFKVETYRKDIEEGCWDPRDPDSYILPGDTVCWMYIFDIPASEAFCQEGSPEKPMVYWLDVQATLPPYPWPAPLVFGWKSSARHWNDDAVWQYRDPSGYSTPFGELRYPKGHVWQKQSLDLAFALEIEPCAGVPSEPVEPEAR